MQGPCFVRAGADEPDQSQEGDGQRGSPSPSEQQNQGESPGRGQPSESESQNGRSGQTDEGQRPNNREGNRSLQTLRPRDAQVRQQADSGGRTGGAIDSLGSTPIADATPLTGDDFRRWSDRMRDVEEMVDDPELRAETARIRERARGFRREYKRHSKEPQWSDVRNLVVKPLRELRQRISQELMRRSADRNALVPIDRDPVPDQFAEQVRRYYENLGRGE